MSLKELEKLSNKFVVMLVLNSKNYLNGTIKVLKKLATKKMNGIYVTANKPYSALIKQLKKSKVDTDKIYFIDLVTEKEVKDADNCTFLKSPQALTELGIVISQAIKYLPNKNKFLFFDSLSTLLIYNEAKVVSKFSLFLINKMNNEQIKGVLITVDSKSNNDLYNQISPLCDNIINLKRGKNNDV